MRGAANLGQVTRLRLVFGAVNGDAVTIIELEPSGNHGDGNGGAVLGIPGMLLFGGARRGG
jgi:hypothetical protein